jgi:hypothetical protein
MVCGMRRVVALCSLAACGDNLYGVEPTPNLERDIISTDLAIDVTARTGTATITFAASDRPGATLEVGDLTIESVTVGGYDVPIERGTNLDLGLPTSGNDRRHDRVSPWRTTWRTACPRTATRSCGRTTASIFFRVTPIRTMARRTRSP